MCGKIPTTPEGPISATFVSSLAMDWPPLTKRISRLYQLLFSYFSFSQRAHSDGVELSPSKASKSSGARFRLKGCEYQVSSVNSFTQISWRRCVGFHSKTRPLLLPLKAMTFAGRKFFSLNPNRFTLLCYSKAFKKRRTLPIFVSGRSGSTCL